MRKIIPRAAAFMASLLAVSTVAFLSFTATASASERLIEVAPTLTIVKVPAPGHSHDWTMKVTNVSAHKLELSFEAFGPGGTALEGTHPLELSLTGSDQKVYADHVELADLLNKQLAIPALEPGKSFVMTGAAELPRAAGDEYRTATADVKFRFVAQTDGTIGTDELAPETVIDLGPVAITGSEALMITVIGSVLVALGLTVVVVRRKGSTT